MSCIFYSRDQIIIYAVKSMEIMCLCDCLQNVNKTKRIKVQTTHIEEGEEIKTFIFLPSVTLENNSQLKMTSVDTLRKGLRSNTVFCK